LPFFNCVLVLLCLYICVLLVCCCASISVLLVLLCLYICVLLVCCCASLSLGLTAVCQHINNTELIYRCRTSAYVSESVEVS
jgi:hypothetical protein